MTHQQLVKEWKKKLQSYYRKYRNGHTQIASDRIEEFLEAAMTAAAKGAAEAGKVEKYGLDEMGFPKDEIENAFNAAISQIERQLKDYFKEV